MKQSTYKDCQDCGGRCCQVVNQDCDPSDRDYIRFLLNHKGSGLYTSGATKNSVQVSTESPCQHLDPDGRCKDYDNRPSICSEYDSRECPDAPSRRASNPVIDNWEEAEDFLDKLQKPQSRSMTITISKAKS